LSADAWDSQMLFLGLHGASASSPHDRRGHGRSSQPWGGHEMNTYADDLAALTEALDLNNAVHVGHSTGGGEVARLHQPPRQQARGQGGAGGGRAALDAEDRDQPRRFADGCLRRHPARACLADRSQFFKDLTTASIGANRPGSKVSQGLSDAFWLQGMQAGYKAIYDCIKAFSETDFTEDLKKIDVPTLIVHGDDDRSCRSAPGPALGEAGEKGHAQDLSGARTGSPKPTGDQLNAICWRSSRVERRAAHAYRRVPPTPPSPSELGEELEHRSCSLLAGRRGRSGWGSRPKTKSQSPKLRLTPRSAGLGGCTMLLRI